MVDALVQVARGIGFEQVETNHREGRDPAQSVEQIVVGFRVGERGGGDTGHAEFGGVRVLRNGIRRQRYEKCGFSDSPEAAFSLFVRIFRPDRVSAAYFRSATGLYGTPIFWNRKAYMSVASSIRFEVGFPAPCPAFDSMRMSTGLSPA